MSEAVPEIPGSESARPDLLVRSADGVQLAVYRDGDPAAPMVLAVHGYPDNASVWDGVSTLLAERFQVVRYDVRGAGASDRPAGRRAYRLDLLAADFEAVLDATATGSAVHLVAHDWGSIQAWQWVCQPRLAGRIASFTSISGPSLGHVRGWIVDSVRAGRYRQVLRQCLHSYYLLAFQLPLLPELFWRSGLGARLLHKDAAPSANPSGYRRSLADELAGLQLYRANLFGRAPVGSRGRRTDVPVQVIAPHADPFVTPALQLQAPVGFASTLYRRPVEGGHWILVSDPELVARAVTELIELVEFGRPSAGLVPD